MNELTGVDWCNVVFKEGDGEEKALHGITHTSSDEGVSFDTVGVGVGVGVV